MEVSTNHCCQKQRHNFQSSSQIRVNVFYCSKVDLIVFKHADIKGVRQHLMSTASLTDDGYCEAIKVPFHNDISPNGEQP